MWLLLAAALGFLPRQAAAPQATADAASHLARGDSLSDAHDYNGAIAEYTLAIQLKPDYAEAYNNRGFAWYRKGQAEPAIADFTRAIALRPDYPKAYNSRGVVYMSHGYPSAKAVDDFDRAIALKPDFRYAYINRANARLLSHPQLALADFHHAGTYPERTAAMVIGTVVALLAAIVVVRRHRRRAAVVIAILAAVAAGTAMMAAQSRKAIVAVTPDAVQWFTPPSYTDGRQRAQLVGDSSQRGAWIDRVKISFIVIPAGCPALRRRERRPRHRADERHGQVSDGVRREIVT